MRILHTSDWHVGRGFHGHSLQEDHSAVLAAICDIAVAEDVDMVCVAGDIYDRALPPEWAVHVLEQTLLTFRQAGIEVTLISGNHDSAQRLGFGRALMQGSGIHMRTSLTDVIEPVVTRAAEDEATTLIYGVPYLEPVLYGEQLSLEQASHTSVMQTLLPQIIADARRRAEDLGTAVRAVVMAHLFVAQGRASDSERSIGAPVVPGETLSHTTETVGGLSVVPLGLFEGFDYVALGHLHGKQRLSDRVRYSGSPLKFSFSEAAQSKGVWLIDTEALDTPETAIREIPLQVGRSVVTLQGPLEEILDPHRIADHREDFTQITITDPQRPERAYQRVTAEYPYLCSFNHAPAVSELGPETSYVQRLARTQTTTEVVAEFLLHVRQRGISDEETALLRTELERLRTGTTAPAPAASDVPSKSAVDSRISEDSEVSS